MMHLLFLALIGAAIALSAHASSYTTCLENRNRMFHQTDIDKIILQKHRWHDLMRVAHHSKLLKEAFEKPLLYMQDIIGPIGPVCKHELVTYATGDDEKRACVDPKDVKTLGYNAPGEKCVVYSIGSNNQWSFEEAIYGE
jgi:hypothetical protein